jgi:hypothetical protein
VAPDIVREDPDPDLSPGSTYNRGIHAEELSSSPCLQVACGFQPMTASEMQDVRDRCKFDASGGRFELFKTTKKYDGDIGREQHGFPNADKLPALV